MFPPDRKLNSYHMIYTVGSPKDVFIGYCSVTAQVLGVL